MYICYFSVENKANINNSQYKSFFDIYLYSSDSQKIDAYMADYMAEAEKIKELERDAIQNGNFDFIPPVLPNKYATDGLNDKSLFAEVIKQKNTEQNYTNVINDILYKAKSELRSYDGKGIDKNNSVYIYQLAIIDKYTKLLDTQFEFEYPHGYIEFFEYKWVNPLIFFSLLLLCAFCFVREQRDRVAPIIRSTKNGRVKTAVAKLLAINVLTAIVVLLFTVTTLLAVYLKIGLSSPTQAMQAFYQLCPYKINVLQGLLFFLVIKISVFCAFATLITSISTLFKDYIPVFAIGVIIFGLSYAVYLIGGLDIDSRIKAINMIDAANPAVLFKRLWMFDLFGGLITRESLILSVYLPAIIVVSVLGIIGYCKGRVFEFSFIKKLSFPSVSKTRIVRKHINLRSIFYYELKKLINGKSIAVFAVVVYMVIMSSSSRFNQSFNYVDTLYKDYMNVLEGAWTQEKSDYIADEYDRINKILLSYDEMLIKHNNGELTSNELTEYLNEYYAAPAYIEALGRVSEQQIYIKENADKPYFLYDTGWKIFLLTDYNIYITALIIVIASVSFGNEHTSGFVNILRSTKHGRTKTFFTKYGIVVMWSFILSLFLIIIQLYFATKYIHMPLWEAPVISIKEFGLVDSRLNMLSFVIVRCVTTVLSYIVMASIVASLSQILKSSAFASFLSAAVFILPRYLLFAGHAFVNMLDGTRIYLESAANNLFGSRYAYFIIYSVAIASLSVFLFFESKTKYCITNRRSTNI